MKHNAKANFHVPKPFVFSTSINDGNFPESQSKELEANLCLDESYKRKRSQSNIDVLLHKVLNKINRTTHRISSMDE